MFRMILRPVLLVFVMLAALLTVFSLSVRAMPQTPLEAMGYPHRDCTSPCFLNLEVGIATGTDVELLRQQRRVSIPEVGSGLASGATMNLTAPDLLNDPEAHIYLNFDENDTINLIGIRDTLCMTDVLIALGLPDDAIQHRDRSVVYTYRYGDESRWIFHSSRRDRNEIIEVQIFTYQHFRSRERYELSRYISYKLDMDDYRHGC